jgi:three-Cys-motif partner protein
VEEEQQIWVRKGKLSMSERQPRQLKLDEIGYWSEVKLDIIRDYAKAYSTILAAQEKPRFHHVYIDAFAGAGVHLSRTTGEQIEGSPLIAVNTQPPFKEYHFIDLDGQKVDNLRAIFGQNPTIHVHQGDCNRIMLDEVLPNVRYQDFRRGLCLLDPYGLHLNWEVIRTAGEMGTIDLFLNFPIADMNRNVFWRNPEGVDPADIARMNAFWGDESWRNVVYKQVPTLFDPEEAKTDNQTIAETFRERLQKVGKFRNVPEPIPMRNSTGAVVYYLYFASAKPVAQNIVTDIFNKYRNRGAN